jgi:hypothetical protein
MLIVLVILLLMLTPLGMLLIRLWRPRFPLFWLIAVSAAFIAWLIILLQQTHLPQTIPLITWKPSQLFEVSPSMLLDEVSWPFALAVVTLTLAALLSDVARAGLPSIASLRKEKDRPPESPPTSESAPDWWSWSASLALAGLGLLAILAENLLAVLLAWSAMDLVEIIIWISQARSRQESERVVVAFSGRLAGIVAILWAGMVLKAAGLPLAFQTLTPQSNTYLVIAVGLRLGVLPGNVTLIPELARRRALSSLVHLVPAATGLALLGRAVFGADPQLAPYLLIVVGLAAVYGGLLWVNATDEREGQGSWVLGMAALALGSAILAQPAASLAWGLALLLPGGLLFLSSARHRWLLPLHIIGLISLSALPYTPTWQGVRLYAAPTSPILVLFLVAHALLLTGYLRHMLRLYPALSGVERWLWLLFPVGLALPPFVHLWIAWWSRPGAPGSFQAQPLWFESWPGLVSLLLSGLFVWIFMIGRRGVRAALEAATSPPEPPGRSTDIQLPAYLARLQTFFSLGWLYRLLWSLYYGLRRVLSLASRVLEGQAGILWALLLLTLMLSLLIQVGVPAILTGGG